jgi:regulatory protein
VTDREADDPAGLPDAAGSAGHRVADFGQMAGPAERSDQSPAPQAVEPIDSDGATGQRVAQLGGLGAAGPDVPVLSLGAMGGGSEPSPVADLRGRRAKRQAAPVDNADPGHSLARVVSIRADGRRRRSTPSAPPVATARTVDPPGRSESYDTVDEVGSSADRQRPGRGRRSTGRRATQRGRDPKPPAVEPKIDADPVAVAREICLRLLTERARTRQELAQALRKRDVPDEAANAVLERFDEVGLIDDAAFAGQWVRSRHNQRGLARRAIAVELRRKGVADEVAQEALAEVDATSEELRARELVERKLRTVPADTPEQRTTAARRLVGMLARRGYPGGLAYRVVREALAAHGADIDDELGTGFDE